MFKKADIKYIFKVIVALEMINCLLETARGACYHAMHQRQATASLYRCSYIQLLFRKFRLTSNSGSHMQT